MEDESENASLPMEDDLESHQLDNVADAQLSTMKKYGINSDEMLIVSQENILRLVLSNKHSRSNMVLLLLSNTNSL